MKIENPGIYQYTKMIEKKIQIAQEALQHDNISVVNAVLVEAGAICEKIRDLMGVRG